MCLVSRASDTGRDGPAFKITCHCEREVVKNIILLWKKPICAKDYNSSCMEKWGKECTSIKFLSAIVNFILGIEWFLEIKLILWQWLLQKTPKFDFAFKSPSTLRYRNQIFNREQNLSCVRKDACVLQAHQLLVDMGPRDLALRAQTLLLQVER